MNGQAKVLFPYWPPEAEWFVVGGPANSDEAQVVKAQYPDVHCIGFEPNPDYVEEQMGPLKFPGEVLPFGLWSESFETALITPERATDLSASVCRPIVAPDMGGVWKAKKSIPVCMRSLDELSVTFGPFRNAVLWLDIEYAGYPALCGALDLLRNKQILLLNIEAYKNGDFWFISQLLHSHGLRLQKIWNIGTDSKRDAQDHIFVLGQ